jgi:flagellar hook-length control protein FliK
VVSAEDAPQSEVDNVQTAELPPQALEVAVAGAVPLQVAMQAAPLTPVPAAPPAIDAPQAAARPGLSEPDSGAPTASARIEAEPTLSVVDRALQPPEPARIAVPAAGATLQQPAGLPTAQPAAAEPSANPDTALLHSPDTDTVISPVPMATERADNSTRTPAQPVRLDIAAPVSSREFGAEVGNRLVWMATHNHQVAELRIDPPQLGPVELRLSIANDQASLSIVSPHAAVRDAIQASLPRLQDMLQALGISLGNVSVGAEGFGQANFDHSGLGQGWGQAAEQPLTGHYPPLGAAAADILPLRAGTGMIDVYA